MTIQLTYAFQGSNEVYLVQLEVEKGDMVYAYASAIAYITEEHGEQAVETIQGISLLRA